MTEDQLNDKLEEIIDDNCSTYSWEGTVVDKYAMVRELNSFIKEIEQEYLDKITILQSRIDDMYSAIFKNG